MNTPHTALSPTSLNTERPTLNRASTSLFRAVLAGLIAIPLSYVGSALITLQAAQSARLSTEQISSWILSMLILSL